MTPGRSGTVLARAGLVALGLTWSAPFLVPHHQYPLTAFYQEWLALALGLAAAAFVMLRADAWREAALPAIALPVIGLMLLIGMQAALGLVPYAEQALVAAQYLLWALLLMLVGRTLARELGTAAVAEALAWFLLAGGLLNALAGYAQLYGLSVGSLVARAGAPAVYGNLGQPNHYAAYLALALAAAAYLHARGRLHGIWASAYLAVLAPVLATAGSRSTWLYLAAFTVLALARRHRSGDADTRRLVRYVVWLVPAFVLAQWVATLPVMQPERAVVTSGQRLFELASGVEARLQLAGEAWRMFVAAPLTGSGWGQFAWHHFLHLGETGATAAPGISNHAHNIVLQLLAETGVVGGALVAGAAALWVSDLWRARDRLEGWWLAALAAVLALHSLLEYPLWYAYFLGIAAVLAGLGSRREVPLGLSGAGRLVVALGIAAGAAGLAGLPGAHRDIERLVFEPGRRDAAALSDDALAAAFASAHREPVLMPYVELIAAHGITVNRERLREKLELNTRVMHFAPVNVVVYRQAMLLALAGEGGAAVRQLALAARAYPAELGEATAALAELARAHPSELGPLLELAATRTGAQRGRGAQ